LKSFDCHEFRKGRLWREEIDVLLTRLQPGLQLVFAKYSGKHAMPGQKSASMSLEEFIDMMSDAGLVDDRFGHREVGPLWNLSMMTNKHELESDRHLNMSFVECLEALARCADKFDRKHLNDSFPASKSKNPAQLDKKLEAIILRLLEANMPPKQYEQALAKYRCQLELDLPGQGNQK